MFEDGWEIAGILQLLCKSPQGETDCTYLPYPVKFEVSAPFKMGSDSLCTVENRDNLCKVPVFLRNWQDTYGIHPPHDPKININNCKTIQTTSTNDSTRGMTKGFHES